LAFSTTLRAQEIDSIVKCNIADPFSLLGAHPVPVEGEKGVAVRIFLPRVKQLEILDLNPEGVVKAHRVHNDGLFEAWLPGVFEISPYRLRLTMGLNRSSMTATLFFLYWPMMTFTYSIRGAMTGSMKNWALTLECTRVFPVSCLPSGRRRPHA